MENTIERLKKQLEKTRENLKGDAYVHEGLCEFANLIEVFMEYVEEKSNDESD